MTEQELEILIRALADELGIDYSEALAFKHVCSGSLFCVFLHLLIIKSKIDKDKKQQLLEAMKRILENEEQAKKRSDELIETFFEAINEKKDLKEIVSFFNKQAKQESTRMKR